MDTFIPAFIGLPGGPELLVVLLLVVLLFGANKLPKLAPSDRRPRYCPSVVPSCYSARISIGGSTSISPGEAAVPIRVRRSRSVWIAPARVNAAATS